MSKPTNPALSERQSFAAVPRAAYRVVYKRYAHGVLSACPNGPAIETWLAESRDSAEERASDQSAWDYEFGIDARWTVERAK